MVATSSSVVLCLTSSSVKGQLVSFQLMIGTGTDPSTAASPQNSGRAAATSCPKPGSRASSMA
eukprot:5559414-Heterocapsa_arctica.AAC.1